MPCPFAEISEEEIKTAFFIHLIWSILKQLSPSGSEKSASRLSLHSNMSMLHKAIDVKTFGPD